jgi:hypothetical protein
MPQPLPHRHVKARVLRLDDETYALLAYLAGSRNRLGQTIRELCLLEIDRRLLRQQLVMEETNA